MGLVKRVKQQAIESGEILDKFFADFPQAEHVFRAAFHLRPTSSGDTTILSTLPIAPMRGLSVKNEELKTTLLEISKVLYKTNDDQRLKVMIDMGFKKRKTVSQREEDAQAALIRDIVLNPKEYSHLRFVASEFELFGYGEEANQTKRPDILAFKNGTLYDIELKNERLTETVTQVAGHVEHIKTNLSEYADCLYSFPNCKIEEIKDVKGVALVPYSEKSGGGLEKACAEHGVELWSFVKKFQIIKVPI